MSLENASKIPLLVSSKHLIDSLPFIDSEFDDVDMRKTVQSLIKQEMTKFRPSNYLEQIPDYSPEFRDPLLQSEYERVSKSIPMKKFDLSHYTIQTPSEEERDNIDAWKKALVHAHAQLEHQSSRMTNLELLQKYGSDIWRIQTSNLEQMEKSLKFQSVQQQKKSEAINIERKEFQQRNGEKLKGLETRWAELSEKTMQLEVACARLENDNKKLRLN